MSISEHFPNDDDLSNHEDVESLAGSQGNSHQDDTNHGLTLNKLYREDAMSEGDAEDDLDNPFFQYQPSTTCLQPEGICNDPSSRLMGPPHLRDSNLV